MKVAAAVPIAAILANSVVAQPQCGTPLANTAYVGSDIAYALVADAASCCAQCVKQQLCSAYTWVPNAMSGGRCYLKTAPSSPTANSGAVSGIVTGATQSDCPFGLTPCPNGACALYADWCKTSSCRAGQTVCPDGISCSTNGWGGCPPSTLPAYLNTSLDIPTRTAAIVSQLSIGEIAPQLNNQGYGTGPPGPPGIQRLAIPPYNWLNEGLHGVARAGLATSFPQISVVGQTWNRTVWRSMGRVLGIEARAKYNMDRRANGTTADYTGVTFYAPNLNLARDSRWGRIQEVRLLLFFGAATFPFAGPTDRLEYLPIDFLKK